MQRSFLRGVLVTAMLSFFHAQAADKNSVIVTATRQDIKPAG